MGSASFVQTSFAGGEWSPTSHGRMDNPKYRSAMAVCRNGYPLKSGAWTRRPGTRLLGPTRNGQPAQLIPFSFEEASPLNLELTEGHMRFFRGNRLVTDQNPPTITDISTANPALVTVNSDVTWATGDQVVFVFGDALAAATLPLLANRVFIATLVSTLTFQIADALTQAPIDGSTLGWVAGLSATTARVSDLATVFTAGSWQDARPVQNETDMLLLQGDTPPQLLEASLPAATATFTISPASFLDGPYLDPFKDSLVTPSALKGSISLTLSNPAYDAATAYLKDAYVTSVGISYLSLADNNLGNTPASSPTFWSPTTPAAAAGTAGFTTDDVGKPVRLYSEPPLWVTGTTYAIGQVVAFNGQYWTALKAMTGATPATGSINPNQPGNATDTWSLNPAGAIWTWGRITGISGTTLIDPALAGSGQIGNMTSNAGINAAFDSNLSKSSDNCAAYIDQEFVRGYVGKSYTAGLVITSCVVYPSSTYEGSGSTAKQYWGRSFTSQTLYLRASNTAPSGPTSGIILGSVSVPRNQPGPVTIVSNDPATTYKYVWIASDLNGSSQTTYISQVQFYGTGAPAGSVITVQIVGDPLLYLTPVRIWRLGAYNPKYPKCGCYHEGRLWLSGAYDNRVDASVSNDFFNFAPTAPSGAVADNNAISYTFNSSDLNSIFWLMPDLQGIVAGTIGGEWIIDSPSSTSPGFAPTNIRARRVTKYGDKRIDPIRTGLTTIFVQKHGLELLEFLADAYSGKFVGADLSEFNADLVEPGIAEIAYQSSQTPIIWGRMDDGSLAGITYRRTSALSREPPEIMGWHRHDLGSTRLVESICVGPSVDGTLDALAMVTNDPETGIRHVEVVSDPATENADITDAWFVDSGVVPSAGTTLGQSVVFTGLWPLNGKKVAVWAAGVDCGDFTVLNGAVTVPFGGLFTARWMTQLSSTGADFSLNAVAIDQGAQTIPVVVGFSYESQGQLLRPVAQDQTGSATGPAFAKFRRDNKVGVLMHRSQGVRFGTNFENLIHAAKLTTTGGTLLSKTQLFSGLYWDSVEDGYTFESQLCWDIDRPYPLTITAIGGFLNTQD